MMPAFVTAENHMRVTIPFLAVVLVGAAVGVAAESTKPTSPNIVLILADDLGYAVPPLPKRLSGSNNRCIFCSRK